MGVHREACEASSMWRGALEAKGPPPAYAVMLRDHYYENNR